MRTSADLKHMARCALQGNYGNACGALLLIYLAQMVVLLPIVIILFVANMFLPEKGLGILAVVAIILILLCMAGGMLLMVGYTRLCYRIAIGDESEMGDLLFAVRNHMLRFVGVTVIFGMLSILAVVLIFLMIVLMGAIIYPTIGFFAGFILGMVFTIAIMCRFTMTFFALIENPDMTIKEAMQLGKELLRGNTWRMIKLELSFFGIIILGEITAGIGFIWIMPYIICTNILFYLNAKDEKYPPVCESLEDELLTQQFS